MNVIISMLDWLHGPFTLLSLSATWPALTVCVMVLMSWHSQYIAYCKSQHRTPSATLIAGVWIGFFGSMIDNAWWGFAWSFDYIDTGEGLIHWWRNFFFKYGVFPNTFFRQGALIWAGVLHVSAENMSRETKRETAVASDKTKKILALSVLAGIAYTAMLIAIK